MANSELQVVNLVMSGELCVGEIDTGRVAEDLSVSNFTTLPGRAYLQKEEFPTINIYKSGKFSVAGSKSREEAITAISWLIDQLHSLGIEVEKECIDDSLSVEFLVLKGDLDKNLNLEQLINNFPSGTVEYEPEQFPALIYKPNHVDGTATIFSTGKVSITGVNDLESANQIYNNLVELTGC
jgi:transcription initiation factor TFIID TATA-box-binding protein